MILVFLVEPNQNVAMTLEVAAHYYKAPKLLGGCNLYRPEINMLEVKFLFAELLRRKVLFEVQKLLVHAAEDYYRPVGFVPTGTLTSFGSLQFGSVCKGIGFTRVTEV